jgi:alkylation response protein AidB-like acyl-CoA dehydrogenase
MELTLTEEQKSLQQVVGAFVDEHYPVSALQQALADGSGYDRKAWSRFAGEIGLAGLGIPDEWGGVGGGAVELGLVLEQLGRTMAMTPFFATQLLASSLLQQGDPELAQRYLPRMASGELTASVALGDFGREVTLRAEPSAAAAWYLGGSIPWAIGAGDAGLVLALAQASDGPAWFAVDVPADGLTTTRLRTLDETRSLARVDFTQVTATRMSDEVDPLELAEAVSLRGAVGVAMEQIGAARELLYMSVSYAKVREQYGRPIGSFQAIKHRCADMLVLTEGATALGYYALACVDGHSPDFTTAASAAKVYCADATLKIAGDTIQVHGGIGFTWEHPAHLYFKRAKAATLIFGDRRQHRAMIAGALAF